MVGGLGILLILLAIIRHIGACVKESVEDREGIKSNLGSDMGYYYASHGTKLRSNNHRCRENRDTLHGRYVHDLETYKKFYPEIEVGIKEMREQKAAGKKKGTVYKYTPKTCGQTVYIDWDTEQVMYLSYYWKDIGRTGVWFYTDFDTQEQVIRKSDRQIAYEKQFYQECIKRPVYNLNEINADSNCYHRPKPFEKGKYIFQIYSEERMSAFEELLGGDNLVIA